MSQAQTCILQLCVLTHFNPFVRTSEWSPRSRLLFSPDSLIYNGNANTSPLLKCGYATLIFLKQLLGMQTVE